jgi:hypothetical protein
MLNERQQRGNGRRWWTRHFLKEGTRSGVNLLVDFKVEDGDGFNIFVRMTPTDFEVLQQMIGCKILSFSYSRLFTF